MTSLHRSRIRIGLAFDLATFVFSSAFLFHYVVGDSVGSCVSHHAPRCPSPCRCVDEDPRSVRCDALNMTAVPPSVWEHHPVLLNLSANRLTVWSPPQRKADDVNDDVFACMRSLVLSRNELAHFRPATLTCMRELRNLSLDGNLVETLEFDTFHGLSKLELLDLSGNRISVLPEQIFQGLGQLKVLLLSGNRLLALYTTILRTLFSLRSLDIADNPTTVIYGDFPVALRQLVEFSAAGTELRQLSTTLFRHCLTLSVINLSRCRHLTLPDARLLIAPLVNLTVLRLDRSTCDCNHANFRSLTAELQTHRRPLPVQLFCQDNSSITMTPIGTATYCSSISPMNSLFPDSRSPSRIRVATPSPGSRDPLPYDPLLGWYTAAVLCGLLFAFIACVWLGKAEKQLIDACLRRRQKYKERKLAAKTAANHSGSGTAVVVVEGSHSQVQHRQSAAVHLSGVEIRDDVDDDNDDGNDSSDDAQERQTSMKSVGGSIGGGGGGGGDGGGGGGAGSRLGNLAASPRRHYEMDGTTNYTNVGLIEM